MICFPVRRGAYCYRLLLLSFIMQKTRRAGMPRPTKLDGGV
jgi:hypothetical protein